MKTMSKESLPDDFMALNVGTERDFDFIHVLYAWRDESKGKEAYN